MFFEFLEILTEIFFWTAVIFLSWNAYILIFNKGIPNIRTPREMQEAMIAVVKKDFESKRAALESSGEPYRVVDLGSGNGEFSRRIARALPEAEVYGIEISRKSYFWSCLVRDRQGLKNLHYDRGDIFEYDVSKMDAVVFYMSTYVMARLGKKLGQEMKDGALVVSHRFYLGDGWIIEETHEVQTPYVFEREFYTYHKGPQCQGWWHADILEGLNVDADVCYMPPAANISPDRQAKV